jgi:DNA-directed RNA polymerase subunit beta'
VGSLHPADHHREGDGIAVYVDLVEGVSMREVIDEATGISSRKVVVDWKQQPRGGDLRPRIVLRRPNGNPITLANGAEARYFLSVDAILSIENGARSRPATCWRASRARASRPATSPAVCRAWPSCSRRASRRTTRSSRDRRPRRVRQGLQEQAPHRRRAPRRSGEPVEYLIPKGKHISVQEGDFVQKGDLLMDGNPVPHDILRVWASRRWPTTSSTRSRRSIDCRA